MSSTILQDFDTGNLAEYPNLDSQVAINQLETDGIFIIAKINTRRNGIPSKVIAVSNNDFLLAEDILSELEQEIVFANER